MRRFSTFHPYSRPDVSTPNSETNRKFSTHSQHLSAACLHETLDQTFSEFPVAIEPWVPDVLESFSIPLMAPQPAVPSSKTSSAALDAETEDSHFRITSLQPQPVASYQEPAVVTPLTYFCPEDYGVGVTANGNGFDLLRPAPPTSIPADIEEQATLNCYQWQPANTSAQQIGSPNPDHHFYQSETSNEPIPQSELTIAPTQELTSRAPHSKQVFSSHQQKRASLTLKFVTRLFQEKFDIYKNLMKSRGMSPEIIEEKEKYHMQRLQLVARMNPHQIEKFWEKCERGVRQAPRASAATETLPSSELNTTFGWEEHVSSSLDHAFAAEQGNDYENSVSSTTQAYSFLSLTEFQDIQGLNEAETENPGGNVSNIPYFALSQEAAQGNSATDASEVFGQTTEIGDVEMINFENDW